MRSPLRRFAVAFAFGGLVALVTPSAALAQSGETTNAAEDLFQRGRGFMSQRDFAAACPLLLESYRIDPAGGTLQNLAVCYEELGKTASAYVRFTELRTISKGNPPRPDRIKLAEEHMARLEPKLSRMKVVASDPGAAVEVGGNRHLQASWSTGILLDPGKYDVVVSAPGKRSFRGVFETVEGTKELAVPPLVDEPGAPPAGATPSSPRRDEAETDRTGIRRLGYVIGGAGIAVTAGGLISGLLASGKSSEGTDRCSRATNPSAPASDFDTSGHCVEGSSALREANDRKDDARLFANVANVLVPLGLVGVGVGAYLVFVRGAASRATAVSVAPSLGGLLVSGRF